MSAVNNFFGAFFGNLFGQMFGQTEAAAPEAPQPVEQVSSGVGSPRSRLRGRRRRKKQREYVVREPQYVSEPVDAALIEAERLYALSQQWASEWALTGQRKAALSRTTTETDDEEAVIAMLLEMM